MDKKKKSTSQGVLANFPQEHILNILLPSEQNIKQKKVEHFNKASLLTLHQVKMFSSLLIS